MRPQDATPTFAILVFSILLVAAGVNIGIMIATDSMVVRAIALVSLACCILLWRTLVTRHGK